MKNYSPVSVGQTWIDGYDNVWYILEYSFMKGYLAKCVEGTYLGYFRNFDKHGERFYDSYSVETQDPSKNLIKEVQS